MQLNSQFFFVGSAVLTVLFMLSGAWSLLLLPFFLTLGGIFCADQEQIESLDAVTLSMLVPAPATRQLLSYEQFEHRELLFYQAGCPVFRVLRSGEQCWVLAGPQGEVDVEADGDAIVVFPGFIYRRLR